MKVTFWGTRGSIPAALSAATVREKIAVALIRAAGRDLGSPDAARAFVDNELTFPESSTYGGNSSCVQIETGGPEYLICDLGSGVRELSVQAVARHGPDAPQTYNVLMSHLHWDHIMGFPFFIPAFIPGNRIRIHGCHAALEQAFRAQNSAPSFPIEFSALRATIEFVTLEPDRTHQIAGFAVTPTKQHHGGDSYGYRLEKGGKTVVYTTNSEHKLDAPAEIERFAAFLRDADLVIFDAMYSFAESVSVKADWGHSSNVVGLELCQLAGARHLVLFHHEPVYDDHRIHQIFQETIRLEEITRQGHAVTISAAYDGLVIDVEQRNFLRRLAASGRAVGALALALALLALLLAGDGVLHGLRLFGLDLVQRAMPRQPEGTPVLIVAIDDDSLRRFGQWPWPRNLVAELVTRIHADQPRVLGIDILWPEPDRLSPARWATLIRTLPPDLVSRLVALPDHDASLGEAIAAGPTVLGIAGLRAGTGSAGPLTAVLSHGGDPRPALPDHSVLVRSVADIDRAARGRGLLSVDKDADGVVRRLPMLAAVGDAIVPSLTLEMLRVATGAPRIDVYADGGGVAGVAAGELALPTEPDGAIRLALSPHEPRRFIPAADLLEGRLAAGSLSDRLVLLGVTGLGLVDRVTTALGPMVGVELHAQLLESVVEGGLAARPRWAPWGEAALLLVAGGAMVALLPRRPLRWYAPVAVALPVAFGGAAIAAWTARLWLIDAVLPTLGGAATLMALVGGALAEADAQRRRLRRQLDAERLAAARLAGEVEAARRIQIGILPRPDALARDPRFDLDAVLEPAKEIGGDLYDFFPVDRRHLFIAIGDVTGKGVPASLFMALGKALYKSCVLRGSLDPAAIMTTANQEISRDNPEMLFITLFAGLLDLDTGLLAYCNAGHEQPYAVLAGEAARPLTGSGGPPLCVVDDFPYTADAYQLRPGELLCLVTDGVTEAMNAGGALFGHAPMLECLSALPPGTGAKTALGAVRGTVAAFVGSAEASDDLTALTVRWTGAERAGGAG